MPVMMTRKLYMIFGMISLILGILGIFLPLLPTTPFLLLTAWCFSRGSEKWHQWLLSHRLFGPPIRDWEENKIIRPRAKVLAVFTLILGLISVWYHFPDRLWQGKYATFAIMLSSMVYILTRKSHPKSSS